MKLVYWKENKKIQKFRIFNEKKNKLKIINKYISNKFWPNIIFNTCLNPLKYGK
jgi:hypothetical protein